MRDLSWGSTSRTPRAAPCGCPTASRARGTRTATTRGRCTPTPRAPPGVGHLPAGPSAAELDGMARAVRLSPDGEVTGEMRESMLRMVRALRLTFGHDVDDAPDFLDLLRGVAALDNMWHGDLSFDKAGPFTLDLLNQVIAAHPQGGPDPDQAAARRVLADALDEWTADPDTLLTDFVDLPAVEAATRWLESVDVADEAVDALKLAGPDAVGEAERSRMFWARVKAEEAVRASGMGERRSRRRCSTSSRAPGWGRRSATPQRAAHPGVRRGSGRGGPGRGGGVRPGGARRVQGHRRGHRPGRATRKGRDFTDGQKPPTVDLAQVRTPNGLVAAPWAGKDTTGEDKPVPYLVRVMPDAQKRGHLRLDLGGSTSSVSVGEFLELLANDRTLMREAGHRRRVRVLGAGHRPARSGGAGRAAAGPPVWWTDFPTDLSGMGDSGKPVLTLHATMPTGQGPGQVPGRTPGAGAPRRPRRPGRPVTVPAPLPRSAEPRSAEPTSGKSGTSGKSRTSGKRGTAARTVTRDAAAAARGGTALTRTSSGESTPTNPVFTVPVTAPPPARPRCCRRRRRRRSRQARRAWPGPTRTTCSTSPCGWRSSRCATSGRASRCRRSPSGIRRTRGPRVRRVPARCGRGADRTPAEPAEGRAEAGGRRPDDHDGGRGQGTGDQALRVTVETTLPPTATALGTLERLRLQDPRHYDGLLDMDALVRRVLGMAPAPRGAPGPLGAAASGQDGDGRGRATSLAALTAYHLEGQDVIDPSWAPHFTVQGNRVPGLNWSRAAGAVAELDTTRSDVRRPADEGGQTLDVAMVPWPRSVTPYVVAAEGRHDRVALPLPDGSTRVLDIDEFVELVAVDVARAGLPKGTPIALAIPFAGDRYLELPRKLADRTGLTVWAHTGRVELNLDGGAHTLDVIQPKERRAATGFRASPAWRPTSTRTTRSGTAAW
ncbi:lonely Cys domain-containing protein [Streptomyces sp. M19]